MKAFGLLDERCLRMLELKAPYELGLLDFVHELYLIIDSVKLIDFYSLSFNYVFDLLALVH